MAAGSEVKGSRQTREDGKMKHGVRTFVTDDGTTSVPAMGSLWPSDSGVTARICREVHCDPEVLPGLYFHTLHYSGFKGYE